MKPIADYEGPRQAFDVLLQPSCDRRILLLKGPAGTGKTRLLEYYRTCTPPKTRVVTIDLGGGTVGLSEIFSRFGFALTWPLLTHLKARVSALESAKTNVSIERNWQVGVANRINVVLHTGDSASQGQRRTDLTDALFEDLVQVGEPIVVLFDTFETAPSEVKNWLSHDLLARVAQTAAVRIVVAGQDVPESNTIDWGHCCERHALTGVREVKHWLPVVREMQRRIPSGPGPEETYMKGICDYLKGNPLAIMNFIEGLEKGEGC